MNFMELMELRPKDIKDCNKEKCIELCRNIMKSFITHEGCENYLILSKKAISTLLLLLSASIPV